MGKKGKSAVHQHLIQSEIWEKITSSDNTTLLTPLIENTRNQFPETWEEIRGLSEGLDLPLRDIFAWNCRGDILADVPDGCTTIAEPGLPIKIGHNEDGLPFFRGHCFILDARPCGSMNYRAFCYPGSIAGHTFGWNSAGIVQTVNNLRLKHAAPQLPRMVVARAILSVRTLQDAIDILSNNTNCGGFHMTLAQAGDDRLFSVEYGAEKISVKEIDERSVHANHALHLQHHAQIITQSSTDRQITGERLLKRGDMTNHDILRDNSGEGLPIRRDDPNDPDHENTLATCMFDVSRVGVTWRIYGEKAGQPLYQNEKETA